MAKKKQLTLGEAFALFKRLPTNLAEPPYAKVIWDPTQHIMIARGKRLARDVVRYMVGLPTDDKLVGEYRIALGAEPDDETVNLPDRLN